MTSDPPLAGYDPSDSDVLAVVALGGDQGHPVIEAIASARAGDVESLAECDPLILVDVLRLLAILGEWDAAERAYSTAEEHRSGAVHFEAGIAALMHGDDATATLRFRRAATGSEPQPMAWNSLAIVLREAGELDDAWIAAQAGLEQMPGDPITTRTATAIAILRGDEASARMLGFDGDVEVERAAGMLVPPTRSFKGHAELAMEAAVTVMRLPAVLGDEQEEAARRLMTRAVALDPDSERARRGLAALGN